MSCNIEEFPRDYLMNVVPLFEMMIAEQRPLAAIFYFGKVFIFCRLINKNVLE